MLEFHLLSEWFPLIEGEEFLFVTDSVDGQKVP